MPKVTGMFNPKMPVMDKPIQIESPPEPKKVDRKIDSRLESIDAEIQQVNELQANKCPVCLNVYNSKQNRKLTEECGHSVCVCCLLKISNDDSDETSCVTCNKLRDLEETKSRLEEGQEVKKPPQKEISSPSYSPPANNKASSWDRNNKIDDDDDDDDFIHELEDFDLNPITSKKPASMTNSIGGSNTSSVFDLGEQISRSFQNGNKMTTLKSRPSVESFVAQSSSKESINQYKKYNVVNDSVDDDDDDDIELIFETDKDNNQIFMVDQDDDEDEVVVKKKPEARRFGHDQIDEDVFSDSQSSKLGKKQPAIVARPQELDDDEDDADEDKDVYECQESALTYKLVQGVEVPDVESYPKINWLFNDIHDCSKFFRDHTNYEHMRVMMQVFRTRFGLKRFRPQQYEAINAALLGLYK